MATRRDIQNFALIICGFILNIVVVIRTEEVVLLDTTKLGQLEWQTHIASHSSPDNLGWLEASFTDAGRAVRTYMSCYLTAQGVDNWLRTSFIPRKDANSLRIEIRFSMRRCVRHSDPSSLQQCKETFNLYYYQMEDDNANEMRPTWDEHTYKKIDTVAADQLYEQAQEIKLNAESYFVPLDTQLKGIYFAFQDTGACVTLISIKVYYITCPNMTINYAVFPQTPVGGKRSSIEEKVGQCVDNAATEYNPPTQLCSSDGSWSFPKGLCHCAAGFEGFNGVKCVECRPGYYKFFSGNQQCDACPDNSYTNNPRSVQCDCNEGYYRNSQDKKAAPCTKPPSAPRDLSIESVSHGSVTLKWLPPEDFGGRYDLNYHLECYECTESHGCTRCSGQVTCSINSNCQDFNATRIVISNLFPSTNYMFVLFVENGVSSQSGKTSRTDIRANTDSLVATKLSRVTEEKVGDNFVYITWELPQEYQDEVEQFEVKYYPRWQSMNAVLNRTRSQFFNFTDLKRETEYGFQVRCETKKGWGQLSEPLYVKTLGPDGKYHKPGLPTPPISPNESDNVGTIDQNWKDPPVGIIAGAIVAVILCMAIATIMIIILLRRNRQSCSEKKVNEVDGMQYGHVVHYPAVDPQFNSGLMMPLFPPPGSVKSYVDPHTYEDPNQAVREFTREIDASHITIESVIGGGEFGDVCKGKLRIPARPEMTVAIKTLKPGAAEKSRLDFLTEASIMGQFDDPNVIFLEGVVTKSNPIMIVTEYMANGSLDTFLRNNDGKFTIIQLVGMMRGIASGMKYLSEMGYIHRDLAARNILVTENLICKVADFGLSREIEMDTTDGAYTTKGGKIPVRWTAPEAIAFRKFTSSSDVWSFGVVMWEVMSYGERPYWNWSNQDVIKAVERSYRLPPPMDCPEACHQLMLDCWQRERGTRPKFQQIVKTLDKLIRAPELLRKVAKPRQHTFFEPGAMDLTQFTGVEDWLVTIKMERYIDNFVQAGYTTLGQIAQLSVKDLINMGITLIGHQKKIINNIQTFRAHLGGVEMSEGFLV